MTNSARKQTRIAGGLIGLLAALTAGFVVRDRTEMGGTLREALPTQEGLIASRSQVPQMSDGRFFYELIELIKTYYVEPVDDEVKLGVGAVRGMVGSLVDPDCVFMSPKQFENFQAARKGQFEGIGAELRFEYDAVQRKRLADKEFGNDPGELVPQLLVSAVLPGSPAEKAGLKVGDRIASVGGRWVLSADAIREFRAKSLEVAKGTLSPGEVEEMRKQMREKARSGISPAGAREKLTSGRTGTVKVGWVRAGKEFDATLPKVQLRLLPVALSGSTIRTRFLIGADAALRKAIEGKAQVTLDLRQSTAGDFETMRKCLALVAPSGTYGRIRREQAPLSADFVVKSASSAPKLTLIVDQSTRGAAQIFASALKGRAKIVGELPTQDRGIVEVYELPDGSGYTLATGRYEPASGGKS